MNYKTVVFESSNWKFSCALYFSTAITLVSRWAFGRFLKKSIIFPMSVKRVKPATSTDFPSINFKKYACFHQ